MWMRPECNMYIPLSNVYYIRMLIIIREYYNISSACLYFVYYDRVMNKCVMRNLKLRTMK